MTYVKSQKGKKSVNSKILPLWLCSFWSQATLRWSVGCKDAKYKADGLKKKLFIEQSKSKMTVPKKSIFSGASGKGMPPTQTLPVEYFVH